MAPIGKRAADSQSQPAPKRQRFIEEFLSGKLSDPVDSSSSEDERGNLEIKGASRPLEQEDQSHDMVDTPKTDLSPKSSGTPEKKLTLPVRNTPARPLVELPPASGNKQSLETRPAVKAQASPPGLKKRRSGNVASIGTPRLRLQAPPSRSLFAMWRKSPASSVIQQSPEQEEPPSCRRETQQPTQQKCRAANGHAQRTRFTDGNSIMGDDQQSGDPLTKHNKDEVFSQLPPEVLRGMYTSMPGVRSKPGLNRHLPPLSRIEDIFDDIAKTAVKNGFEKFLDHLQSRELKVATMFSGTESPLLALHMLKDSGTTAFGSEREVPTDIDLLVIGFPCVDFSNLNLHKKGMEDQGESGHTFFGVMRYCERARPPLIVVENVCSAPWDDLVKKWEWIGYTAFHTKVDTKNYYLPQTRERGYMICIYTDILKRSRASPSEFFGDTASNQPNLSEFSRLMKAFERPASSPITHFLLKETDPRFRIAVDDISSMPIKDRQAVDWTRYKARHLAYRMKEKLGDKRPLTKWNDNGACYPPDFYWRKWMQVQTERVWDTLDSNYLRAFIRGYDMNFKSRFIDLSQGIDRELDTRAYGVAGCLTPRGQAFITSRGGPLLGIEGLALQGIPIDRLLLSSESQRDLGDLAGNAMSSTVVGSAICSVLILYFYALDPGEAAEPVPEAVEQTRRQLTFMDNQPMIRLPPKVQGGEKLSTLELHEAAKRSAKICACEGQATAPKWHLLKCVKCGHTACTDCGLNPLHHYVSLSRDQITDRWMDFENHLQEVLPMRLELGGLRRTMWEDLRNPKLHKDVAKSWDKYLCLLDLVLGDELRFHSIARQTSWTVYYEGTHSRLELLFSQVRVQWLLYANSTAHEPSNSPLRQILQAPIASMVPSKDDILLGLWYVHSPVSSKFEITIEGKGNIVPSFYSDLGLQHPKFLNTKVYSQITISAADSQVQNLEFDIRGDYELLQNCGAANGSLHKKVATRKEEMPIYFFLDPSEIGEADFDSWVFSLDHERLDTRQTRVTIAETRPGFTGITARDYQQTVQCWYRRREAHSEIGLQTSAAIPTYHYPSPDVSIRGFTCGESYVPFWTCLVPATRAEDDIKKNEWQVADLSESPQMVQRFSWLLQRASSLRKFEDWSSVRFTHEEELASCSLCSPIKPRILWTLGEKDQVQPYENPEDAAEYEQNIKQRPAPFLGFMKVDPDGALHLRVCLNVITLLHRARGKLCKGEGLSLNWRLCIDNIGFLHPHLTQLKEKSNDDDEESCQPPHFTRHVLRREQLRSLTWMVAQEADNVAPFEEEEVAEALIPSINWRAEARAATKKYVKGGILGDEVGYGKTAISLALFDVQHSKHSSIVREDVDGAIPVKATLVVVPNHLVDQWRGEIRKFLGNTYRVLEIKTVNALNALSIRDIQNAHIVLASATLFRGDKYYQKLSLFASPPGEPRGDGRIFSEWLKDAMDGIRTHVNCLLTDGPDALLQRIHDRTEELRASDIYRKYQPSKRLKGAKLQEYLARMREERRRNGKEDIDNLTAIKKIVEARREQQKQKGAPLKKEVKLEGPKRATESAERKEENEKEHTSQTPSESSKEKPSEFKAVVINNTGWSRDEIMSYSLHLADDHHFDEGETSEAIVARPARKSLRTSRKPRIVDEWQESGDSTDGSDDDYGAEHSDEWSDSSITTSRKKPVPSKKRKVSASDSDTPAKPKPCPQKRVTKQRNVKGIPTGYQVRQQARQTFAFHLARNDWRCLKSPLLHMFEFNRIIIDEFTYSKDRNFTATLAISARNKWILSGTPPLNDFADVKSFSPFLDVALGEDEDISGKPENERLRVMQRERTEAEQFRPFITRHSAAWHKRRHEVAQGFLDRFMRKNIPLFDEIPWTEHICGVTMSPTERGSYLETYMQMMSANLQIKRTGEKEDDSQEVKQLDLIMKESMCPEEVLLKLCSLSLSSGQSESGQNHSSGLSIIEHRESEVKALKSDLALKLKQTRWLRSRIDDQGEPNHFDNLIRALKKQGWGDQEITKQLLILIDEMERCHRASDGHLFYATAEEEAANRHDYRPPMPLRQAKFMSELKECTDNLRRIIIKIVFRTRGIRLFRAIQAFHRVHAAWQEDNAVLACDICQKQGSLSEFVILGECGHIACESCLAKCQEAEECQAPLCTGSIQGFRILRAADVGIIPGVSLGRDLPDDALLVNHGSKMSALAQLIKDHDIIPKDDRIILFIQFPEVMKAASDMLKETGVSHLMVTTSDHHASRKIIQFQSNKQDIRVLILQLGDVTAAGLNLQVANHIIFLSPLFTMSKYDYTSGMTQAIGRARRYGQTKHVHIYHFLTLNTLEVNIFEQRRQEVIVRRAGKFLGVSEEDARADEACWSGKDLQASQLDKNND
ncbi:hypothetical protein KEM54_004637 [Ascosphaera aggregata]|nr:hypothetical protein KEM54_004637 [Ascosphaera aggregata]